MVSLKNLGGGLHYTSGKLWPPVLDMQRAILWMTCIHNAVDFYYRAIRQMQALSNQFCTPFVAKLAPQRCPVLVEGSRQTWCLDVAAMQFFGLHFFGSSQHMLREEHNRVEFSRRGHMPRGKEKMGKYLDQPQVRNREFLLAMCPALLCPILACTFLDISVWHIHPWLK